ncbi:hypothetical protein MG296_00495 [Flavobacteriaceae bacterium TK19130]|nr:hypothetical protein [Thermobacterium salinum]
MKISILKYFAIVICMFIISVGMAQNDNSATETTELSSFDTNQSRLNFLASQENSQRANQNNAVQDENSVFIRQVGDYNTAVSRTQSQQSDVDIIQLGDRNYSYLNLNATTIENRVVQNGDDNIFMDFGVFRSQYHGTEVIQDGDNQTFTRFGSNSISEKLKVNMQGDDSSIIIRNFN